MRETTAHRLGSTGLYLFAFCLWLSSAAAYAALGLMLVSFCLQVPEQRKRLAHEPLLLLFVLFLLFVGLQSIWLQVTGVSRFSFKSAWDWISLWLFILVALHLGGDENRILRCLVLAFTGLLLALAHEIFFDTGWEAFVEAFHKKRYGILFSQNEAGHYSAVLFLGFLLFSPRLLQRSRRVGFTVLRVLFWASGFLVSLEMLLLSGSRASWLACALGTVICVPWLYIAEFRTNPRLLNRSGKTLAALLAALLLFLGFLNLDKITNRIHYTLDTDKRFMQQLLRLDFKSMSLQNWGGNYSKGLMIRSALSYYGIDLVRDRPWMGWGTAINLPRLLAQKTGMQQLDHFKHLHNGFVILPARFGLLGSALFFLAGLYLLYGLFSVRRTRRMSRDIAVFLFGSLLITAIVGAFNFRWTQMDFRFFWLLLAGMAATGRLCQTVARPAHKTPTSISSS